MYDVTQMTLWLLNHTSLVPRRAQKASRIWFIFYLFLCRILLSFVWPHTWISQKTWLFLHVLCEVMLFICLFFWRRRTFLVLLMHLNSTSTCFTCLLHLKRIETDNTSLYHRKSYLPQFLLTLVVDLYDAKCPELFKTFLSGSKFTYLTFLSVNSLESP